MSTAASRLAAGATGSQIASHKDAVDDLAHRPSARSTRAIRRRQVRHDHEPFLIRHIGLVSAHLANMLLSGGWGPHGDSGVGLSNPLESHPTPATQPPFETASWGQSIHGFWDMVRCQAAATHRAMPTLWPRLKVLLS